MDGLAEFEKELAREKEERRELERKDRKHRHDRHHRRHEHREHDEHHERDRGSDRDRKQERGHEQDRDRRGRERGEHHKRDDKRQTQNSHKPSSGRDITLGSGGEAGHRRKRTRRERSEDVPENDKDDTRDGSAPRRKRDSETAEREDAPEKALTRDSWMTAPSGIQIDYVHRQTKLKSPPPTEAPRHHISSRELNSNALQHLNNGQTLDDLDDNERHAPAAPTYKFGDEGSQWRMTKLEGVYTIAEQSGRPVEAVAVERFGSLQEFDEAREERSEMERRRLYGKGYAVKEKPTGDLYRERMERVGGSSTRELADQSSGDEDVEDVKAVLAHHTSAPVDQTTLNRLRAQLMKAKLRKAPDVVRLEKEYDDAMASFSSGAASNGAERAVVLDASHSRLLAGTRSEVKAIETRRGRDRGLVEANEDMTIEDMVREERRTRGITGGEGRRLAERIAKDGKFVADLDYLDENAEKLAKHVHKSEANLKNIAINEFSKMNKILESCPLCHHEDRKPPLDLPLAPVVSLATRVYLTLPTEPELTGAEGGAVIVPVDHHTNLLECSDDEWEEIRNFMKSLVRLYHDQGRDVIFYENAATPQRRMHAALVAVPIPYELGDTAPAFFREAILSADEEWSQHKKVIDTGKRAREGLGKMAFRKSLTKEMPYFHAWFSLDGGLGHIVEDAGRWPKGDLFAREIVGGMLDVDASIIKRQGRWTRTDPRLDDFKRRWRKFDWTRIFEQAQ